MFVAHSVKSPDVATEAMVLSMEQRDKKMVNNIAEFSISKVINAQFSGESSYLSIFNCTPAIGAHSIVVQIFLGDCHYFVFSIMYCCV